MTTSLRMILDPTGGTEVTANTTLAPRLTTLEDKTLGLLDNGKPNGSMLLSEIGDDLRQQYRLRDVLTYTKPYFGTPVEQTQTQKIIEECDFVVTAIGD